MKKFSEILVEIEDVSRQMKTAEKIETDLVSSLDRKSADYDEICQKLNENAATTYDLSLKRKILQNNAKIALFNEVAPIAVEVLNKYANKPYVEKTAKKISDEVLAQTGSRCYININYSIETLVICPQGFYNYDYSISIGIKSHESDNFLAGNKIQGICFEDLELWYISDEYIEFVDERVFDIKAAYARVLKAKKELEEFCDKFNALAVGDIKHITADEYFYNNYID